MPAVSAQTIGYQEISNIQAAKNAINVPIYNGQLVSINFSEAGETIMYLAASDRSRFVYNTDAPVGNAQSIFLLPIERINFPGAIATNHPNLVVKTLDSQGQSHLYNFRIQFQNGAMKSSGIKIVKDAIPVVLTPKLTDKIRVSSGQSVGVDAVERGLELAISKKYTTTDDPVVPAVRDFVFRVRNGETVNESLLATNLRPAVVESLAELYLQLELPAKLTDNINPSPQKSVSAAESSQVKETIPVLDDSSSYIENLDRQIQDRIDSGKLIKNSKEHKQLQSAIQDIKSGILPREAALNKKLSIAWFSLFLDGFHS
jgi:hypothetical protein